MRILMGIVGYALVIIVALAMGKAAGKDKFKDAI
jgi:hypothetical protein